MDSNLIIVARMVTAGITLVLMCSITLLTAYVFLGHWHKLRTDRSKLREFVIMLIMCTAAVISLLYTGSSLLYSLVANT